MSSLRPYSRSRIVSRLPSSSSTVSRNIPLPPPTKVGCIRLGTVERRPSRETGWWPSGRARASWIQLRRRSVRCTRPPQGPWCAGIGPSRAPRSNDPPTGGQHMSSPRIRLHKGDLPAGVTFSGSVAIDTETLGLRPHRDRLCLVQLSGGNNEAHLVQLDGSDWSAPRLKALHQCRSPEDLPLRALRHRNAGPLAAGSNGTGLVHEDRVEAGAHLHGPTQPQGPVLGNPRPRAFQATAKLGLGGDRSHAAATGVCGVRCFASSRHQGAARGHARPRGAHGHGGGRFPIFAGAGAARSCRLRRHGHFRALTQDEITGDEVVGRPIVSHISRYLASQAGACPRFGPWPSGRDGACKAATARQTAGAGR